MGNPLLAAGKLDRRVTIVRAGAVAVANQWTGAESAAGRDSLGEAEPAASGEITRWASQRPTPGFERFQTAETGATALWRFVFRWQADLVLVTDTLRTSDGRTWDIKAAEPIGRNEGWEVLAAARMEKL